MGLAGTDPDFNVDFARLRNERLRKVQREMAKRDIGVLVLTNPVNIRYTTDVSVMPIWTAINLARFAVVPVFGDPVIFEYGKALFRATSLWPKSRPIKSWQLRFSQTQVKEAAGHFAAEVQGLMTDFGVAKSRIAIDVLDCHGYEALRALGHPIEDADGPLGAAHKIKTADEIALLRGSCLVAEKAMKKFQNSICPGISENELLGTFWGSMQSLGGEHCSTRLIVSGDKMNPWFYEAGDRKVEIGDLVGIDTDMVGPHGYLCDISRTFLCGDTPNADQIEAYQVAYDFIQGTIEMCRPGISYRELVENSPRYPEAFAEQGYSCMIHGDGMDDEPPFLPFRHDLPKAYVPSGHLEAGMVLSVEFYAGKKGARDGVKLEEQILITDSGPKLLANYPFEDRLLGNKK